MNERKTNDEWALLVGRCMMAFGYIEQDVNIFWQRWNSDPTKADAYRTKELAQKIKEIIEFVEVRSTELGQTNKKNLVNNLNVILKAAAFRNLIAHNPLGVAIFDITDPDPVREVFKSMRDGSKMLTYDELAALSESLYELRVIMGTNAMSTMGYSYRAGEPYVLRIDRFERPIAVFEVPVRT